MYKKIVLVLALLLVTSCAPQKNDNACEKGLNVEHLFAKLRTLPENYSIREVTQYYKYSEVNKQPIYRPERIFAQDKKSKFLVSSWISRQDVVQDCKVNRVFTDGYNWSIGNSGPAELQITNDQNARIKMKFKKISDDAFIVVKTSESDVLGYEEKTLFRWGETLPNNEEIETAFIDGLNAEGLNIPDRMVTLYQDQPGAESINANVADLINLQIQLKNFLRRNKP